MTIYEAITRERQLAKEQRSHIGTWNDEYSKKCEECAEEHEQLAEWLEELKTIKEMDLSIPQHFTKEQSDWIKAYCIKRNIEFYNKALGDFADKIISLCDDGEFMNRFNEFTATTTLEMAEQLKAGGENEQSI